MMFCARACYSRFRADRAKVAIADRFWAKAVKSDRCWQWTGAINNKGYGQFRLARNEPAAYAHRIAYELETGERVPHGMFVCHACDNPRCVRPSHLFLGSHRDNTNDMVAKERQAIGERNSHAKITPDEAIRIINARGRGRRALKAAAESVGISISHANAIGRGVFWKHLRRYAKLVAARDTHKSA